MPSLTTAGFPNLALIGRAGAGKTTGAEYLARHYGYTRMSFAAMLKEIAGRLWSPDAAAKDRDKLQRLGVAVREIDEDAWVNVLMRQLPTESAGGAIPVVIDDCRFPNEYWALKERGFVFVRIEATEETRVDRLLANGKLQDREQLNHVSETSLDDVFTDYRLANVAGPLAFCEELTDVIERKQGRSFR